MAATPPKSDTPAKPARNGLGNAIAAGGKFEGKFQFVGPVIIGAHLRGEIETDDMILVEASGKIEGRVRAATLIVHGSVSGDIEASRALEVCSGGRLEGVAFSPSMRVEERTFVSADLLIAPERTVAHINKAASVPDLSNVAPLSPGRTDAPEVATAKSAAG
ncbi:MAG: polymer-forming cytoskeletal protein [Acidobacteria bacterium]|jgi:cytoskeletal protein CcmA (bactofilin family)|nr:polymer-forming cytoskeletal protein [Acidobacteriota bacterium]